MQAEPAQAEAIPAGDIRILLFDVFGTVVDWRSSVAREVAPFLAEHAPGTDPAEFAAAWRRRYQPAMEAVRSGARPFTRLDILHRENLEAVLRDHGLDPAAFPEPVLDHLNKAWHRLDPWPDSVEGLRRLKTRFLIAPLSNGNIALMLNLAKRAGLPWDAILGAEVARAYKPTAAAYLNTAEILGLAPGQCMLVAAHNNDLAAARDVGFRTAFVPRPTEHGAGQDKDLAPAQDWDFVSPSFPALADLLHCPA